MQDAAGKGTLGRQLEYVKVQGALEDNQGGPCKGLQECWESQWQQYLKVVQPVQVEWGNIVTSEVAPWEDTKAFLDSFEQVAKACRWPRREWAARLLPALSGEAEQVFRGLEARDQEDYGKVKAAILRREALRMEMQRQHFRQFSCQEVEDPRRIYSQVQELCHQWLKPEKHSKERILELLILEQFLASLPPELQGWIRAGGPATCSQAVALVEDFLMSQQAAKTEKWQRSLKEEWIYSLNVEEEPLDVVRGQVNNGGSGIKHPSSSNVSLPPERQEKAEANADEGEISIKEVGGGTLQEVTQTLAEPGGQTTFWEVLEGKDNNGKSLNAEKRGNIKVENSLWDGKEPEDPPRTIPQISQGNVLEAAEKKERWRSKDEPWMQPLKTLIDCDQKSVTGEKEDGFLNCGKGADRKESLLKMENSWCKRKLADTMGILKQRCETREIQWKQLVEREAEGDPLTGGPAPFSKRHPRGEMRLFSKYGRRYHYRPEFVTVDVTGDPGECPKLEKGIQKNFYLTGHHGTIKRERKEELYDERREGTFSKQQGHHAEEKPDSFPEDGKSISSGEMFITFQRNKKKMKLYKCFLCNKLFSHKSYLRRHQKIHTGEKPYECSLCGKCFGQRGHLNNHCRIHTGEKPFKCPDCKKRFSRRDNMIRHRVTHEGTRPHKCPDCGKPSPEKKSTEYALVHP